MSEKNIYKELLLLESRKRDSSGKEILSFRPRMMHQKVKSETPSSSGTSTQKIDIANICAENQSPTEQTVSIYDVNIKEEIPEVTIKEEKSSSRVEKVSSSEQPIKQPEDRQVVDVSKALQTISFHLLNNKKFIKAMKLMLQLVESSMGISTGDLFFVQLTNLMKGCPTDRDITSSAYSQGYIDLVTMYYEKKSCILEKNNLFQLDTYYILIYLRASFATDDPWSYSQSCKTLKSYIEKISMNSSSSDGPSSSSHDSSLQDTIDATSINTSGHQEAEQEAVVMIMDRESAIIGCLEIAFKIYHWEWAKNPCDTVYACAAERRLRLGLGLGLD
jgi:hypothetical protein